MNRVWPTSEIYYPESDGQPMAETLLHQRWLIRVLGLFQRRYRDQPQVFVGGNLMVYFTEGNPNDCFSPDLIVLLESNPQSRRVLKLWEEPQAPNLVLEITSRSSRLKDEVTNIERYARLGIAEYILFDPESEYLTPPLQAYRLNDHGRYLPITLDRQGRLVSEQTQIAFSLNDAHELLLHDVATGALLLTDAEEAEQRAEEAERRVWEAERRVEEAVQRVEAERRAKEVAERQANAERQARLQAEARIAELESAARRLRGE